MIENVVTACTSFTVGSALTWMLRNKFYRIKVIFRNRYTIDTEEEPKMVIVTRTDLPLSVGKLASQCAHAAVSCTLRMNEKDPKLVQFWEVCGQPKIVVKCNSESGLMKLAHQAKGANIMAAIVTDAGRTETKPGTKTVLGIGPARIKDINKITGNLKLL